METHNQCRCCMLLQSITQVAPELEHLQALLPLINTLGAAIGMVSSIPHLPPVVEEEQSE